MRKTIDYKRLFEIVGMIFILIAFGWQFFVESRNDRVLASLQFDHIATRLDELHERQLEIQTNQIALASQLSRQEQPSAKYLRVEKYQTPYQSLGNEFQKTTEVLKNWRAWLFIIGSLLVIVGKLLELTTRRGGGAIEG